MLQRNCILEELTNVFEGYPNLTLTANTTADAAPRFWRTLQVCKFRHWQDQFINIYNRVSWALSHSTLRTALHSQQRVTEVTMGRYLMSTLKLKTRRISKEPIISHLRL
jgi:hypothetical protein